MNIQKDFRTEEWEKIDVAGMNSFCRINGPAWTGETLPNAEDSNSLLLDRKEENPKYLRIL